MMEGKRRRWRARKKHNERGIGKWATKIEKKKRFSRGKHRPVCAEADIVPGQWFPTRELGKERGVCPPHPFFSA
jgi:hypothetical protein